MARADSTAGPNASTLSSLHGGRPFSIPFTEGYSKVPHLDWPALHFDGPQRVIAGIRAPKTEIIFDRDPDYDTQNPLDNKDTNFTLIDELGPRTFPVQPSDLQWLHAVPSEEASQRGASIETAQIMTLRPQGSLWMNVRPDGSCFFSNNNNEERE